MSNHAMHEPPMPRVTTLMAHSIPWVLVVAVAARVGDFLSLIPEWLDTLTAVAAVGGMIAMTHHLLFGGLCLRCMRETPLDPQRQVARNKWFLWEFHCSRGLSWTVLAGCLALSMVGNSMQGLALVLCKVPMDAMFFTLLWGTWIHHRLQPWCPYCRRRWGNGGDVELVPDPDPAEKGVR